MTRQDVHDLIDGIPDDRLDSVAALIVEVVADPTDERLSAHDIAELDQGLNEAEGGLGRGLDEVLSDLGGQSR